MSGLGASEPIVNPETGFSSQAKGETGAGVVGTAFGGVSSGALGAGSVGVYGISGAGSGHPAATAAAGVWGECDSGNGVCGASAGWNGVEGDTWSAAHAGVAGSNYAGGPGVWGYSTGNAGQFEGNVAVTGDITARNCAVSGNVTVDGDILLQNPGQDCAEDFDVADPDLAAGTVVVMCESGTGSVRPCDAEYATTVVGIISGAGGLRPAITLGRQPSAALRMPVALVGKVYCKADATYAPISVGDLLTTSRTPGHAMRATDTGRAFGSVIGKALGGLGQGRGMIPVLVALQ